VDVSSGQLLIHFSSSGLISRLHYRIVCNLWIMRH